MCSFKVKSASISVSVLSDRCVSCQLFAERWHSISFLPKRYTCILQQMCLKDWIGCALLGTRQYNFQPLQRLWAPQYFVTEKRTNSIMTIADHTACQQCIWSANKKLSYRRETARQLPTWGEGLGPPAHSPSAPSGYTYAWSNPKPATNLRQACRPLSAL